MQLGIWLNLAKPEQCISKKENIGSLEANVAHLCSLVSPCLQEYI
jgi:hypothetical protein